MSHDRPDDAHALSGETSGGESAPASRATRPSPWISEHYGFADAAPSTHAVRREDRSRADPPVRVARAGRRGVLSRGRLMLGSGLAVVGLVAGSGGYAFATTAGPNRETTHRVGVDPHAGDHGRGGALDNPRGR